MLDFLVEVIAAYFAGKSWGWALATIFLFLALMICLVWLSLAAVPND